MNTPANYWDDSEREEGIITEVRGPHNGWYEVTSDSGWSVGVSAEYGVEPRAGDRFVTWGSVGHPIRGQAINDRVLYYRTIDEQAIENQKDSERRKAERIAEYEAKRGEYDARVAALPEPLRQRIADFRAFGGDAWRWSHEPYELMCCEQAAKLAARFPAPDAIIQFAALDDYDAQKAAFPEMDSGHSGNSWGASVFLARLTVERPDLVPKAHGALCPLTGCEDYGCFAVRASATEE